MNALKAAGAFPGYRASSFIYSILFQSFLPGFLDRLTNLLPPGTFLLVF
jgi:hypothetical protein